MGGKTPKFTCRASDGRSIRVKYFDGDPQSGNREVFAEVVATRLFWALGLRRRPGVSADRELQGLSR